LSAKENDGVIAIVQKVINNGKHGPFVVTKSENFDSSITFSLEPNVWLEETEPEPGEAVFLYRLRKKRAGWRAKKARYLKPCDEQKANRKEQTMLKGLINSFKPVKIEIPELDQEEEVTWQEWVDFEDRSIIDLISLIESKEVRPIFKKRAIILLLAPLSFKTPFYWKATRELNADFIEELSTPLAKYTFETILKFRKILKKNDEQQGFYNSCFLELLKNPNLNQDNKNLIIKEYAVFKQWPYTYVYGQTRPEPLSLALESYAVPEDIKRKIDAKAREIILNYHVREKRTSNRYERLFLNEYAEMLQWFAGRSLPYSKDFFADQIDFIISLEEIRTRGLFNSFKIVEILKILADAKYKDLRYRFSRFILFHPAANESIIYTGKEKVARMIEKEFAEKDSDIKNRLQELQRKAEIREEEQREREERKKKEEEKRTAKRKELAEKMK